MKTMLSALVPAALLVWLGASTPPVQLATAASRQMPRGFDTPSDAQGDDCDVDQRSDTLIEFTKKCEIATGVDVPGFDCDAGTLVPETHPTGAPLLNCDRPNVLNAECDPGSRFQVLAQTADVTIVAHCRKRGNTAGNYEDIAVIQYNQRNGATCFYQALGNLPPKVTPPREGNGMGKFPWMEPPMTAAIRCVRCHDNGPFVRSPYLAQLQSEPVNRLPGTKAGAGRWDQRFSWNQTIPYNFVGSDFQSWKAYSVSVAGTGSACTSCHRLGISSVGNGYQIDQGTAQTLGVEATATSQFHKNMHSADAPIWMKPFQTTFDAVASNEAHAMSACAKAIVRHRNDPTAPPPPDGCSAVQFAQGNTCRGGPVRVPVNDVPPFPDPGRKDETIPVPGCPPGTPDCPYSFCYWRKVRGPFWQETPSAIPVGDPAYRGSFLRLFADGGQWKTRYFSDSTGLPPNAAPGGVLECTLFNDIAKIPDPRNCFGGPSVLVDPDGTRFSSSVRVSPSTTAFNALTGFIGNIAQANGQMPDDLRLQDSGPDVLLSQAHSPAPPPPLKLGPLTGESWEYDCTGWTPDFLVKDLYSEDDVQLVAYPQSKDARCFITGVTGAWSSTRSGATEAPTAEIYSGAAKELRLRVSPGKPMGTPGPIDRVGAYASCIRIR